MSDKATSIFVFVTALLFGLAWLCLEVVFISVNDAIIGLGESAATAWLYVPWQLLLFALMSVPMIVVTKVLSLNRGQAAWLLILGATLFFVITQTALAMYRTEDIGVLGSIGYVILVSACFTALLWLLTAAGRFLPAILSAGWPLAALIGWSMFFVPMARRSGAPLAYSAIGFDDWMGFQNISEIVLALVVTVVMAFLLGRKMAPKAVAAVFVAATLGLGTLQVKRADAQELLQTPDIVIILIDTMRGDALGVNSTGESLTPNLDALAAESINFSQAYSGANATKAALPTLFASQPLQVTGFPMPREALLMQESLSANGYFTFGATANPLMSIAFGYDQGFDLLHDANQSPEFLITAVLRIIARVYAASAYEYGLISSSLYYEGIDSLLRRAVKAQEQEFGPTFVYVQSMDVHGPYLPPKEYLADDYNPDDFLSYFDFIRFAGDGNKTYTEANATNLRQRYEAEIRATDASIGRYFDQLKAMGRWDDTLVWIVADHGDAFGEHDATGHTGRYYGNEVIRIPMILKLPASADVAPKAISSAASLYDVMPTTLALLGIDNNESTMLGRNLMPMIRGDASGGTAFSGGPTLQIAVRWPWKLQAEYRGSNKMEAIKLFNLADDPHENVNLVDQEPDIAASLVEEVNMRLDLIASIDIGGQQTELDAEKREKLRSLGYIE